MTSLERRHALTWVQAWDHYRRPCPQRHWWCNRDWVCIMHLSICVQASNNVLPALMHLYLTSEIQHQPMSAPRSITSSDTLPRGTSSFSSVWTSSHVAVMESVLCVSHFLSLGTLTKLSRISTTTSFNCIWVTTHIIWVPMAYPWSRRLGLVDSKLMLGVVSAIVMHLYLFTANQGPAWKKKYASDMYFIPMLDDTQGYYEAADGVCAITPNSWDPVSWQIQSGGRTGEVLSMASSAGNLRGRMWERVMLEMLVKTSMYKMVRTYARRVIWRVSIVWQNKSEYPANICTALSSLQYKNAVR